MRYFSVCSGIEAATVAWGPLGWEAVAFSEVAPFPAAVLAARYPDTPNIGDITTINGEIYTETIDLMVGGTPCQDFSLANSERAGLDGDRSGLARHFVRLLAEICPVWFVWENVPGCLSTHGGKDFESILSAMDERGYGLAWRVLDAQYFGVPQRRRRVFVVGYRGAFAPAGAVLFEPESLLGNFAQGGTKKQEASQGHPERAFGHDGDIVRQAMSCKWAKGYSGPSGDECHNLLVFGDRIRRMTPLECERLQGFPDGYTDIPGASDYQRYIALGNSMAVPVMRWIGQRIDTIQSQLTR